MIAVLEGFFLGNVTDLGHQVGLAATVELPQLLPLQSLVKDQLPSQDLEGGIWYEVLGGVGVVSWRGVDHIEGQSQSLVQHLRDDPGEEWTAEF